MIRKTLPKVVLLAVGLLLISASACFGAQLNFQQIRRDNTEMRKSIVWLLEGLVQLSKSNNKDLALQSAQKKKILPIFQALVREKIIVLEANRRNQFNNSNNSSGRQAGGQFNFDPNDPRVQERVKKLQEQTDFGNKQSDLIDRILTKKQSGFIDNLDFNADKYGFADLRSLMPAGGAGQGQGQFQRPDPQTMAKIRQVMQTGRDNLIKLCNEVQKLLKS